MKRHTHADLIHAWCEGAEIEVLTIDDDWVSVSNPQWNETSEYRIKDPYAELKAAAADPTKQVRVKTPEHEGKWQSQDVFGWYCDPKDYEVRDKPSDPQTAPPRLPETTQPPPATLQLQASAQQEI